MAENPGQSKYYHSYPGKRQRVRSPSQDRKMIDNNAIYTEKLDKGAIRVLTLHRGSGSDVFKCDLRKIRLAASPAEQTPPYEALSYVWGSKEDPRHIYIGGGRFAVTKNLFEALTYLRHPESDRTLWIDAICINQLDDDEKTVQIHQMHQVYGNAEEVVAWIGKANPDTHEIFDSIVSKGDGLERILPGPNLGWGISFRVGDEGRTEREKVASKELADRPYWLRAWTFQEMKFATLLTIQCGVDKISYGGLHSLHINKVAHARVRTTNENDELVDRYFNNLDSKLPELIGDQDYPNHFLDCLLDRQCCDRRDNIFAFHNLFLRDLQQRIPINYKASAKEVLLQSARAIIESTGSLQLFVIRSRQIPPESREERWQKGMPSWCPYLAAQYGDHGLKPQNMPSIFTEKARVSFYTNTKILVRGFVVGWPERSILPENVGSDDWKNEDYKRQFGIYTKCLELGLLSAPREKVEKSLQAEASFKTPTLPRSLQATTRTLLVDHDGDSTGAEDLIKYASGQLSEGPDENDAKDALYQIHRNIRSRQVCSFRVSGAVVKALRSSEIPREYWLNPLAVVPRKAQWSDAICVISGCPLPVVLRRSGDIHHIIGEAFFDTGCLESVGLRIKLRDFIVE